MNDLLAARELARLARLESLIRARHALLASAPEGSSGELRYATDHADLERLDAAIARERADDTIGVAARGQ